MITPSVDVQITKNGLYVNNNQQENNINTVTAETADSNINNINDPDYLSPFEKLQLEVQMDSFATIYAADKDIATPEGIDFTAYDAAYQAYLTYMTPLIADMTTYSPIVRSTFNGMVTAVQVEQKQFNTATQAQYNQQIKKAQTDIDDGQTKYKALQSEAETMKSSVAGISDAADRAISSAGFASNAASTASQAASSAVATANEAAAGVITAKTDAANALTSAATALNAANGARDSAATAIGNAKSALDKANSTGNGRNLWAISQSDFGYFSLSSQSLVTTQSGDFNKYRKDMIATNGAKYISVRHSGDIPSNLTSIAFGRIIAFDKDQKFISVILQPTADADYFAVGEIPENTVYVLLHIVWGDSGKTMIQFGNQETDWTPAPEDVQVQISNINGELSKKVSQDTYDTLAGTVNQVSTLSKQNQSELATKADSQTVDTLKQRVTTAENTLTQTATKTELQQTNTDVDKLNNSVNTNASHITAQAGKIDGLLNSTTDIKGKITTLQGNFDASSKQLSTTMSKVDSMTSGGGRNLIAGSATDVVIDDTVSKQGWAHTTIFSNLVAGQQYTFSSDIVVNAGSPSSIRLAEFNTAANSSSVYSNVPINNGHIQWTFTAVSGQPLLLIYAGTDGTTAGNKVTFHHYQLETGIVAHDWSPAPEDQATVTALTKVKQTADSAQVLATNNQGDISKLQATAKGLQTTVNDKVSSSQLTQLSGLLTTQINDLSSSTNSKFTQTSNDINAMVKKGDVVNQFNLDAGGALLSTSGNSTKIVFSSPNIIFDSNNPVQIPNVNIPGVLTNKTFEAGTITATTKIKGSDIEAPLIHSPSGSFKLDGNTGDIIGASIHSADNSWGIDKDGNINGATINAPTLNLGFNGTFTESYDYTHDTSWFLPKKATGSVSFNHGVIEDQGTMQTYANGVWGGMNDSSVFTAGLTNNVWTEYAPGYYKIDMYKQGSTTNVLQRTYADPTGYYYTSASGDNSYLGNVLQTSQVQTAGVLTNYIGPGKGALRLQIGQNGKDYGLQVGSYANKEAVLSDFIYNSTTSGSPNVHIDIYGRLVRTTSASKYKYNIKNPDIEDTLGDRLLNVHLATWNDKRAVDSYAEQLSAGEEREKTSIDKYYGLIAEQLRDAGLDMFINYGKNHEIEGIQYDRAWVPLLSVIRRLNNKVNEYELRLNKLEGQVNE